MTTDTKIALSVFVLSLLAAATILVRARQTSSPTLSTDSQTVVTPTATPLEQIPGVPTRYVAFGVPYTVDYPASVTVSGAGDWTLFATAPEGPFLQFAYYGKTDKSLPQFMQTFVPANAGETPIATNGISGVRAQGKEKTYYFFQNPESKGIVVFFHQSAIDPQSLEIFRQIILSLTPISP